MELPVRLQLRELGLALALGAGLGLWYDLLRPLRRGRVSTPLWDGFYCLSLLLSLLAFAVYAGRGRLRLFALGAMALSGGLWLRLCSPLVRGLLHRVGGSLGTGLRSFKKFLKKRKKLVAIDEKSVTMSSRH